jgi:hypothetical protein
VRAETRRHHAKLAPPKATRPTAAPASPPLHPLRLP